METKQDTYQGEVRSKRVVAQQDKAPMTVAAVAHRRHDGFWYRRQGSEGTRGRIDYELTKRQVTRCHDGYPAKTVWLVSKRPGGANPP